MQTILLYDHDYHTTPALKRIFPDTDFLLRLAQVRQQPLIQFWQSCPCVILGLQDKRLTQLQAGLQWLHRQQWPAFIRNSGGLAVISDPGIINLSYFIPDTTNLSIDQAYELMFADLQSCLAPLTLDHFEVQNSYCPGTYDVVLQCQKIAGLAQRRLNRAGVVMAYIAVNGNQQHRGALLQKFYQLANQPVQARYPQVNPASMTTLAAVDSSCPTSAIFKARLLQVLAQRFTIQKISTSWLTQQPQYASSISKALTQQQQLNRNLYKLKEEQ